jgi:hypothetical protein
MLYYTYLCRLARKGTFYATILQGDKVWVKELR